MIPRVFYFYLFLQPTFFIITLYLYYFYLLSPGSGVLQLHVQYFSIT